MSAVTVRRRTLITYGLVVVGCLLAVVVIDLVTNELDTGRYFWDFALYYDMAENGFSNEDFLYAPFAYRFVTPLLAGAIADGVGADQEMIVNSSPDGEWFITTTHVGFRVIAYVGAVAQLALVFVLAEQFAPGVWRGLVAVAVVALSLYSVKFLLFDVSRPDHLAYPLMVIATLAVFRRKIVVVTVVSCIGLLIREFLIIPPAILVVLLLWDFWRERSWVTLAWIGGVIVAVSLVVIVPRVVIPVVDSAQLIDPLNDSYSDTLSKLLRTPRSRRRDLNLAFNAISYTLPVWLLLTVGRAWRVWKRLAGYRLFLVLYAGIVLVLAMYGGTDIWRFMTYLFIPLVIVLVVLLRDEKIHPAEIGLMLLAVAVYNRIWQDIPNEHGAYLDFYGGYDDRVNQVTEDRAMQLVGWLVGMIVLRALLLIWRIISKRRTGPGHDAPLSEPG